MEVAGQADALERRHSMRSANANGRTFVQCVCIEFIAAAVLSQQQDLVAAGLCQGMRLAQARSGLRAGCQASAASGHVNVVIVGLVHAEACMPR